MVTFLKARRYWLFGPVVECALARGRDTECDGKASDRLLDLAASIVEGGGGAS